MLLPVKTLFVIGGVKLVFRERGIYTVVENTGKRRVTMSCVKAHWIGERSNCAEPITIVNMVIGSAFSMSKLCLSREAPTSSTHRCAAEAPACGGRYHSGPPALRAHPAGTPLHRRERQFYPRRQPSASYAR